MSRKYTLEEVEYIRTKANVTYDEVIALLDAYEGDVVRVMAELERAGKLHSKSSSEKSFGVTLKALLRKGYENRMVVRKGDRTIANFSIIFMLVALCFAFHLTIPALLFAVLFGYKINFRKEEGAAKDFSDIIYTTKKAAESVKNEFRSDSTKDQADQADQAEQAEQPQNQEPQPHTGNEQQGQDQGQTQGTQPRTADVQQGQAQVQAQDTQPHTANQQQEQTQVQVQDTQPHTANQQQEQAQVQDTQPHTPPQPTPQPKAQPKPQPKPQSETSNPNQYARPDKDDDIIIE